MKAFYLSLLIVLLINVETFAADPNCEYCEHTPKCIQVTFSNIALCNGRCETTECGECSIITTDDPNSPINRTYILKQDGIEPCRWFYADPCGPVSRVACEDNETYVATGLEIEVIKGDYGPNSVSVSLNSKLECWMLGLASYFWVVTDANDSCVKVTNAPNIGTGTGILDCCCSLWLVGELPPCAPPWYAGINGTVTIRKSVNLADFAAFADGWLNDNADFEDLGDFLDEWLAECE